MERERERGRASVCVCVKSKEKEKEKERKTAGTLSESAQDSILGTGAPQSKDCITAIVLELLLGPICRNLGDLGLWGE